MYMTKLVEWPVVDKVPAKGASECQEEPSLLAESIKPVSLCFFLKEQQMQAMYAFDEPYITRCLHLTKQIEPHTK
jgi:hypothetical protein